jgi:hypothetical protein
MVLIAIWVVSPFVLLFVLHRLSANWAERTRAVLYGMMPIIAALSLIVYLVAAAGPVRPKPAAPFVGLPPVLWLLIALTLTLTALVSRSKRREQNRVSQGDERSIL